MEEEDENEADDEEEEMDQDDDDVGSDNESDVGENNGDTEKEAAITLMVDGVMPINGRFYTYVLAMAS